jgi:hypothetical protein
MQVLESQIIAKISFSFTELQNTLEDSLQLSLETKCGNTLLNLDDHVYKNQNNKFQITNGRSCSTFLNSRIINHFANELKYERGKKNKYLVGNIDNDKYLHSQLEYNKTF